MENKLLHTPEGVRDIYNDECEKKLYLLSKMRNVIRSYGYRFIETPTFEFFDIFGKEVGTTPSKELYKFFDREGNTLVLRPDITPSVARAASKYFPVEKKPVRLCYEGNVFINNNSYQGRLKESTQLGVEFIGENSIDADSEIIALVVKNLKEAGLEDFQISIGHADLFRGLVKEAGFDEEETEQLKNLILNKNFFGVEEFISNYDLREELVALFNLLGKMYASPKEWDYAFSLAGSYPEIKAALEYLKKLYELLEIYDVTKYISFEMGLISSYQYYTGILFSGYTFGSGEPIVKGGRYDGLLSYFGKNAPAIGFALMVDQLLLALERQKIHMNIEEDQEVILYTENNRKIAVASAEELRNGGKVVTLVRMDLCKATLEEYQEKYSGNKLTVLDGEF
ncbi:MAG: ATP phosphoribosyltransferase regulatory subunit [Lachnospiraceae bacterium]|nr:ATP phosphoribosyltransferase regulatory subunit [Lachnospiraceae bacterium]